MDGTQSVSTFVRDVYPKVHLGLAPASLQQMVFTARVFERWAGRPVAIGEMCDDLLRDFLAWYLTQVRAPTCNSKRRQLLAAWRCAVDLGLCAQPPGKIRAAPEDLRDPEGWRVEELQRVLSVAAAEPGEIAGVPAWLWWTSLMRVLYFSGERISAVFRAEPKDFEMGDPGGFRVPKRKNHRGMWHWLPADAIDDCRQLLEHGGPREVMWPVPWSRENRDERLRAILGRAGVAFGRDRGGLWYKFRRTAGSLVEAAGGDSSKLLGNTRGVFERHYRDPRLCGASQAMLLPPLASPLTLRIVS